IRPLIDGKSTLFRSYDSLLRVENKLSRPTLASLKLILEKELHGGMTLSTSPDTKKSVCSLPLLSDQNLTSCDSAGLTIPSFSQTKCKQFLTTERRLLCRPRVKTTKTTTIRRRLLRPGSSRQPLQL